MLTRFVEFRSHAREKVPTFAVAATLLCGCGGPLVEPHPAPPMPPASIAPSPIPATPARTDFGELPRVPASNFLPPSTGSAKGRYYEVRRGDTLTSIANRHGTTVERLLESNGIDRATVLQPGQLIYIPDAP